MRIPVSICIAASIAGSIGERARAEPLECRKDCLRKDQDSRGCCVRHGEPSPPKAAPPLVLADSHVYADPIKASRIVLANGAVLRCAPGKPLALRADTVEINGTVAIECNGVDGKKGVDGKSWVGHDVCTTISRNPFESKDQYRERLSYGVNAGGDGTDGTPGTDASDVEIRVRHIAFAPGARLEIRAQGGRGGRGGAGGVGQTVHGVAQVIDGVQVDEEHFHQLCRDGPWNDNWKAQDGNLGQPAPPGRDGRVTITGATTGTPTVEVAAGPTNLPASWRKPASPPAR